MIVFNNRMFCLQVEKQPGNIRHCLKKKNKEKKRIGNNSLLTKIRELQRLLSSSEQQVFSHGHSSCQCLVPVEARRGHWTP